MARSHIVRRPLGPAAAADMVAALDRPHGSTGVGGAGDLPTLQPHPGTGGRVGGVAAVTPGPADR